MRGNYAYQLTGTVYPDQCTDRVRRWISCVSRPTRIHSRRYHGKFGQNWDLAPRPAHFHLCAFQIFGRQKLWRKVTHPLIGDRPLLREKAKQMSVHVRTYFSEAVLTEIPHLRAYARLMTNDLYKADHEVEETVKRAMSIMDRMSKRADLRVQLLTILRGFLISAALRRRRDFIGSPAIYEKLTSPFRIGNGHSDEPLSLASALMYLDFEDREAVVLSTGMSLPYQEAAKLCTCEIRMYEARLRHGLTRLAQLLPGQPAQDIADELASTEVYPVKNAGASLLAL